VARNWDDIIIDPSTGLPELPEGWTWKVTQSGKYFYATIWSFKKVLWWKVKTETTHDSLDTPLTKDKLLRASKEAYIDWRRYVQTLGQQDLLGTYPPKRLN
jgi:hypothetical protein